MSAFKHSHTHTPAAESSQCMFNGAECANFIFCICTEKTSKRGRGRGRGGGKKNTSIKSKGEKQENEFWDVLGEGKLKEQTHLQD